MSKITEMRDAIASLKEQKEAIQQQLMELEGKSIPLIVETMTELGIDSINLSQYQCDVEDIMDQLHYYTGWDEGSYTLARLFVDKGRLMLIGIDPYSCKYGDNEHPYSVLNLSSITDCHLDRIDWIIGSIILRLLDKDDDIYSFTEFDEDCRRVESEEIEQVLLKRAEGCVDNDRI